MRGALGLAGALWVVGCSGGGAAETDAVSSTDVPATTSDTRGSETGTTDVPTTSGDSTTSTTTTDEPSTDTGAESCVPGAQEVCYSGPFASDGVGICVAGSATCSPDGRGFGPCDGEVTPAQEDCDSAEDENCDGLSGCPAGTELWSKYFGDDDRQWASDVAIGVDDSIYVTGINYATIDLGAGPLVSTGSWDTYLARFDAAGGHVWSKQFGGSFGGQIGEALCVDGSGAVYLAGNFDPDIDLGGGALGGAFDTDSGFIAKYDPDGAHLWSKAFVPSQDQGFMNLPAMACDPAGGVVLGGHVIGDIDLGGGVLPAGGGADLVVARLDAQGEHLWSRRYGDAMDQFMGGVAFAPQGDVVFCGELAGSADFGGGPRASVGEPDVFVARLDGAGVHRWSAAFGGDSFEACTAVVVDVEDAAVIAGSYLGALDLGGGGLGDGEGDLFLAKLDADGAHVWSDGFGAAFLSAVHSLRVDGSANIYLYGRYESSFEAFDVGAPLPMTEFGSAVFAAKYASTGSLLWARSYPGAGDVSGGRLVVDSANDLVLTGRFDEDVDLGGGPHVSAGDHDVFLTKVRIE